MWENLCEIKFNDAWFNITNQRNYIMVKENCYMVM